MSTKINFRPNLYLKQNFHDLNFCFMKKVQVSVTNSNELNFKEIALKFVNETFDLKETSFRTLPISDLVNKTCHYDRTICLKSLRTLKNILLDPKKQFQALNFNLLPKLSQVIQRFDGNCDDQIKILNEVCAILTIIAQRFEGSLRIFDDVTIIKFLLKRVLVKSPITESCLQVLCEISYNTLVATKFCETNEDGLNIHQVLPEILFDETFESQHLYNLLTNLIEGRTEYFVDSGYFQLLVKKLVTSSENIPEKLKTLGVLGNSESGQKLVDSGLLVEYLIALLKDQNQINEELQTNAIFCLKNVLISHFGLSTASKHWKFLVEFLTQKARTKTNSFLQYYSLQALLIISTISDVKIFFRENSKDKIQKIRCLFPESIPIKKKLLSQIQNQFL